MLIFDGYGAHTMVKSTLDYLVANRIHAVCMPAHTSQFLQPLNVACSMESQNGTVFSFYCCGLSKQNGIKYRYKNK